MKSSRLRIVPRPNYLTLNKHNEVKCKQVNHAMVYDIVKYKYEQLVVQQSFATL